MKASKIAYKPVGLALGAVSGALAGEVFKQVWKAVGHDEDAPDATDQDLNWPKVMLAASHERSGDPGLGKETQGRVMPDADQRIVGQQVDSARHFVGDRLSSSPSDRLADLPRGSGTVVRRGARHLAVYREEDGALHTLSARCTTSPAWCSSTTPSGPGNALVTAPPSPLTEAWCRGRGASLTGVRRD